MVDQSDWLTNFNKDMNYFRKNIIRKSKKIFLIISFLLLFVETQKAQTVINTSFESSDNYTVGNINNQNLWKVTSGNGQISSDNNYIRTGNQGLRIYSAGTTLQTDYIPYSSSVSGLSGDVYLDFWINMKSLPSSNFAITGYDLTSNSRSFMMEFLPTGKIKLYNGSSGWATQPLYTANTWKRISVKIDNAGAKCQFAIDGIVQNNLFAFREIKGGATSFDFHSIRFSMDTGTADVAVDDMYIGTTPIADITFQGSSTDRTISVTQPSYGTISLTPSKSVYQLNDQVSASISVPEHYLFTGWNGDLSGTDNPISFIVDKNYSIGATVVVDPSNPPAQYPVNVIQPTGATIVLSPQQTNYYEGTSVKATLTLQSGYQFNGWTGDLSGVTNPITFLVSGPLNIGASVSEIQVSSTTRFVANVSQFKDALNAMNPGDTILVMDGTYNLGGVKVTRGGSALKPILIKSQHLFGAKITGASYFNPQGQNYTTYEGFKFELSQVSSIFKMEGCTNVRITRNWFTMPSDTTQNSKWITVGEIWANDVCRSQYNRIDHNLFEGKHDLGALLVIDGSHGTVPAISKHDRIDHNIFRDNTPRVANEKETIRIGVSDLCNLDAYTVVENNLFEDCDGDPEIVSVKSYSDTIRNNTFHHCLGTISLRQGKGSVVEGNFMFGDGKTAVFEGGTIGCGGVRMYGLNHKIFNNYFFGLTGYKWDAAITITNGDVDNSSTSLSSHFLPENIIITNNTLINNVSNIEIGFDNGGSYGKSPKNCVIANNIVSALSNPIVKYYSTTSLAGVSFINNILFPSGTASIGLSGYNDSQIKTVDPQLVLTDCRAYNQDCEDKILLNLYKLLDSSPAVNASTTYDFVTTDFEGQPAEGIRDIGADEYNAFSPVLNGPMDETRVGPEAPDNEIFEQNTASANINNYTMNDVKISSNPFNGNVVLTIPNTEKGKVIVTLYNALGQQVQQDETISFKGNTQMQISTQQKGLLFCIIRTNNNIYSLKLISK